MKLVKSLNLEQRLAYEAIKSGMNVFITGGGGVGKSFLIDVLNQMFKSMAILAPTGISALNVSGETIHSFFKLPFGSNDMDFLTRLKRGDKKRINAASIILIDEISMCRCDTFDTIDYKLRLVTGKDKPFGGKQVVAVGDFAQIEPVVRNGSDDHNFLLKKYGHNYYAFNAESWDRLNLVPFVLTEPVRHGEDDLIRALRNIRMGNNLQKSIDFLNQRVDSNYDIDDLRLVTTNRQCDDHNEDRYEQLEGKEFVYNATLVDKYKERPSPEELFLKVGCRVIFTSNGTDDDEFVNGDLGEVVKLTEQYARVKLDRGPSINVFKFKFESHAFEVNKKGSLERVVKGTYEQLPIKLAYSITVHKSQGATLDRCIVDFSYGSFAYGQCYVALSRVRTLAGLYLTHPLKLSDIKVNHEAIEFTKRMSLIALERREKDIKRFNIDISDFESTEPKKDIDTSAIKCKNTEILKQIIENQIVSAKKANAFTISLENLEQAGITTFFEIENGKIIDGGFAFKGKKYQCDQIFDLTMSEWIKKSNYIKNDKLTKDLLEYISFLNERSSDMPYANKEEAKEFKLTPIEEEALDREIGKIRELCISGKLPLSKIIDLCKSK